MGLKRRGNQEGSEAVVELLPVAEYEGRLVYVADLGIQDGDEWKGDKKPDRQMLCLGIEILGHTVEIDGVEKPQVLWADPFKFYSALDKRGTEFGQYKVFCPTAEDGDVSDWEEYLGGVCTVKVKHSKDGKYANVGELLAIPEKYQKDVPPMLTTDSCVGDVDDPDNAAQANMYGLPQWLVDNKRVVEEEPEQADEGDNPYT